MSSEENLETGTAKPGPESGTGETLETPETVSPPRGETAFQRLCKSPEDLARAIAFNEACSFCAFASADGIEDCGLDLDGGEACARGIAEFLKSAWPEKDEAAADASGTPQAVGRAGKEKPGARGKKDSRKTSGGVRKDRKGNRKDSRRRAPDSGQDSVPSPNQNFDRDPNWDPGPNPVPNQDPSPVPSIPAWGEDDSPSPEFPAGDPADEVSLGSETGGKPPFGKPQKLYNCGRGRKKRETQAEIPSEGESRAGGEEKTGAFFFRSQGLSL